MRTIVLIVHNVRSCHNVGSLLRTADGLGVSTVYLTGYTPYPLQTPDKRLPHIATKMQQQIRKTALGAEESVHWEHRPDVLEVISTLRNQGFTIASLEQTPESITITGWAAPEKLAIIVGRETEGIETEVLEASDLSLEIPMLGAKESFNVVQAAAMALYHCRFSKS